MLRLSLCTLFALTAGLSAQSPVESAFVTQFYVTANQVPITALCDVTVTEPQGIVVHQIDVQTNTLHGTDGQMSVWVTPVGSTHVGNEQNPFAWTQVSTASRVHDGGRVEFTLDTPFVLDQGTYGFALHCIGMNPVYVNGASQSPVLPNTYSTNEVTLDMTSARLRQSDPVDPFGGSGPNFSPRQPNIALHYEVGNRYVEFVGTPTGGASPLDVQFTSYAASGLAGGVQAYAWDFDNDTVIDSMVANPMHTYTTCGTYTVSLTIVDAAGALTETKVDYVATDVVTPDFQNLIVSPGVVQFLDMSSPAPTAWEWDLNGDGLTDSTVQNPQFVYANDCDEVTVSLTVTLACRPPVTLTRTIAVASTLQTTFASGLVTSGTATSAANYFDVNVSDPFGATVCALHVNSDVAVGLPVTVNLYQTADTYVGKTGDATLWRLVASETVNSAGAGNRTFVPLSIPLHLAVGDFGICMEHIGASPVYTNLGGEQVFTDGTLTITAGTSQAGPVFDPASATFTPRIANVALHYSTTATTGAAGYGFLAPGCPGTLGVPTNTATTLPTVGGQNTIVVGNLPFGIGVMAFGVFQLTPALDLGIIGMPACPLHHTADATATLIGVGNEASLIFPIPNTAALVGTQIYTQALSYDPGVNAFGFAISDAAVMLVGN